MIEIESGSIETPVRREENSENPEIWNMNMKMKEKMKKKPSGVETYWKIVMYEKVVREERNT